MSSLCCNVSVGMTQNVMQKSLTGLFQSSGLLYLPSRAARWRGLTLTSSHRPAVLQDGRAPLHPPCCASPHLCCSPAGSPIQSRLWWGLVPFPFLQCSGLPLPCFSPCRLHCPHTPQALGSLSLLVFLPVWPIRIQLWFPLALPFHCLPICGLLRVVRESCGLRLLDNITSQRFLTSDKSNTQGSFYFSLASSFP